MPADLIDFDNSLRTVGWNAAAVRDFETVAYGAVLSLIHYIDRLTPEGRLAWSRANNRQSDIGQQGVQKTREGSFLAWLNQLRLQVYGTALDDQSVGLQPMRVSNPWSLNDQEFTYCMMYIKTGRVPDTDKFEKHVLSPTQKLVADRVTDDLKDKALEYLEKGAILVGGSIAARVFKISGATPASVVIDVAWSYFSNQLEKAQLSDLTARYAIDEQRRLYLASRGLSSYRQIAAL